MYLLDTNICIYAIKGKFPTIADNLLSIDPDNIKISAVTVMELEYGAAKSNWSDRSREAIKAFLASFEILPFTDMDAAVCGQLRAELAVRGTPIGAYDIMIAAQSVSRGLIVVTYNTGEFSRVSGIVPEDWTE